MTTKHMARVVAILAQALLVSLVSFGSAMAQSTQGERQAYFGEVVDANEDAITLELSDGKAVLIKGFLDKVSLPKIAGSSEDSGSADLTPDQIVERLIGARVAVVASSSDGDLLAVKISVIPSKTKEQHKTLTVVDRSGNTIIAESDSGDEIIVELDFEPAEDLIGQVVTFVGERLEANRFRAKKVVSIRQVVDRLNRHVQDKSEEVDEESTDSANKEKRERLAQLKTKLEENIDRQIRRYTQVLVKSPEDARASLEAALENINTRFRNALASLGKAPEDITNKLKQRILQAVVDSVDIEAGKVHLRTKGGAIVTVAIVKITRVRIGSNAGNLEELQAGDEVEVQFDSETGEAIDIHAPLVAKIKGRLEAVDAESRTITLALADGGSITLTLSDIAKALTNQKLAALRDAELGTVLIVTYNPRTLEPLAVATEKRAEHVITLDRIDKDKKTVTGRTDDGREVTLKLVNGTSVDAAGTRSGINALKSGTRIRVSVDQSTGRADKISNEDQELQTAEVTAWGKLAGIRRDIRTLSLARKDGSQVAVSVDEDTEILVDGSPSTLEEIDGDAEIQVTYQPGTLIARRIVVHRRVLPNKVVTVRKVTTVVKPATTQPKGEVTVAGTLAKVDPSGGVIVILTENRRVLELNVTDRSEIYLNGEPTTDIGALPTAAQIKARYNADGNEILELAVHKRQIDFNKVREKLTVANIKAKLNQMKNLLSFRVKGRAVSGNQIVFVVSLDQKPVTGAEVTVSGVSVGSTNDDGAVTFTVPEDAQSLVAEATFEGQTVALKLRVLSAQPVKAANTAGQGNTASTDNKASTPARSAGK